MHEILAAAMFLEARKDRRGQIFPNLTFESQKLHFSGHAFISRNKGFGITVPGF